MNYESLENALNVLSWQSVPERVVSTYKKFANVIESEWTKSGSSGFLDTLGQYLNLWPGKYPGGIPNSPAPLTSMLVGSLAGAGLGYGAGYLGEKLLPNSWERGKLRRTGALAGAALGMAPGAMWGTINKLDSRPFNDNELFQQPSGPAADIHHDSFDAYSVSDNIPGDIRESVKTSFTKIAELYPGSGIGGPPLDVDKFINDIWHDPGLSGPLTPREQAAVTGLVAGAANLPGKSNNQFVTPMDIGRMAAGMGAGYLSGMLVGKALGALAGMPEQTQNTLKNTGMYAGLISDLIPIAFGGR
jgi:hypothetical protein